ncbi:MAG: histidine phosphatase family protein [Gemmatimonadetes bacterium]|nr:histidine phosphatase family protein [Gemmatimonadota bacterium]MCY3942990.1 histidine phosphatase family protein [Gemmatimonadota bacterium]
MLRLLLARHAKSSWHEADLPDHDRPLSKRGLRAAPLVARALAEGGHAPELVYCSTARRTRSTWELMSPYIGARAEVRYLPELYLAPAERVLEVISGAPASVGTLMVMGHNPATHAVAVHFGELPTPPLRVFPTGAVAVVELASESWRNAVSRGRIVDFVAPKAVGRVRPDRAPG